MIQYLQEKPYLYGRLPKQFFWHFEVLSIALMFERRVGHQRRNTPTGFIFETTSFQIGCSLYPGGVMHFPVELEVQNPFAPRSVLARELERRCKKNPRYSLRAFATSLGLSHTVLSLALSGKRPLSQKACRQIAESLAFSDPETHLLLQNRLPSFSPSLPPSQTLDLDRFEMLSEWHCFAILSLLEIPKVPFEPRAISKHLGISLVEARLAIERLKRLGLVGFRKGKWRQVTGAFKTDTTKSTAATRRFQAKLIQKAVESLENDPLEKRDHTAITFAMNPAFVPYAKKQIENFRKKLCMELENAGNPKAVYTISVQLFPMSKEIK